MKREIWYSLEWGDDNENHLHGLTASIENAKNLDDLKQSVKELMGLGFTITGISDGDVRGRKIVSGPLDIFDPAYKAFRCVVRQCDD